MKDGRALMHVLYVWECIVSLYYINAKWMFMELGRYKAFMVPHICKGDWPDPPRGKSRAGQKWVKEAFWPDPPRGKSRAGQKWVKERPVLQRTFS